MWLFYAALPYVLLGCAFGLWRIQTTLTMRNEFTPWFGHKQDFEALVMAEADVRQDRQLITIQPQGYSQRLLITTTLGRDFLYGDRVWVRGKVVEPKAFDDFDYPGYLARFATFGLVRYPKIIVLRPNQGNVAVTQLLKFKVWLVRRLLAYYGPVEGNFLLGILIGAKRGLPQELLDTFSRTGTSHILAVSGFNISVLLAFLGYSAYIIGRKSQLWLSLFCVGAFVVIAGPSASVLRAAGMGLIVMVAVANGRLYNPLPALLLVAASMVVINPRILYWDIGFQLSAAATAGILLGAPLLDTVPQTNSLLKFFVSQLGVTLCAILFTLPISLLHFGQLSLIAPIANLVIVPAIPLVMALGGLSMLPILGAGFAFVNTYLLQLLLWLERLFAKPSWSSVPLQLSGSRALLCLLCIVAAYLFLRFRLQST
jgi:competence protein ComEC